MAKANTFDTDAFLKFMFSTIFLFVCCLVLILYLGNAMAVFISFILRTFVIPRNTLLSIGSVQFSFLQARVFFKDLFFENENCTVRIVDGYFTFAFWGFWFKSRSWTSVKEFMVRDTLIGMRCRVRSNFRYKKGTVVGIELDKKRVFVQTDPTEADSSVEDEEEEEEMMELGDEGEAESVATERHSQASTAERRSRAHSVGGDTDDAGDRANVESPRSVNTGHAFSTGPPSRHHSLPEVLESDRSQPFSHAPQPRRRGHRDADNRGARRDSPDTHVPVDDVAGGVRYNQSMAGRSGPAAQEPDGGESVKSYDCKDVHIRSRPGMCQLHINGLRLCVFNATGKYRDLVNDAAAKATASSAALKATEEKGTHVAANKLFHKLKGKLKDNVDLDQEESRTQEGLDAAMKLQRQQLTNKSFTQKFFAFIGAFEVELFASTIDIGGANAPHPYFLHMAFLRAEGKAFISRDGCAPVDLFRFAFDLTMQQMDIRMAQMDSTLTENQVLRNPSLRDRAQIMFKGTADRLTRADDAYTSRITTESQLIRDFGIILDGKHNGSVHIMFYKDMPNVYAGEDTAQETLPKTGCEIVIDAPVVRYGPWIEYCRTQMWQYFLPQNYRPLQPLEFVLGRPRPNAGFEFFVEFMRETRFEVPFKRRAEAPSPPFGIKDSHKKGMLVASIGAGSQFIQKAVCLLPGETKQTFEALFMGKSMTVWANCVLDRETILCHADSVQLFLDRQDDAVWNRRKLWNILPKISGAEVYFFMVYVDFFLDLLNDWQFAQHMYHGVPLTTEEFNTYERVVRDFVPNVKRFEVFLDGFVTVYISANTHNVVYSDDPCDLTKNTFFILKAQQGVFTMVLPADQYPLSFENELERPLKVVAQEIKAYVSLPLSHPLYDQVSMEIPCAYSEYAEINGSFIINVGNQSVPQDRWPVIRETGRTKHTNFLNLDVEFTNMHGTLMGPHIKGLINFFENVFLDSTMTITPDELFWLLAKLQSHATTGKNKRKEFKQYLESKAPIGNDLEVCVLVRITDLEAVLATGQGKLAPGVLLQTAQLTFTYVKQFACGDVAVTLTPVVGRFCDTLGNIPRNGFDNFLTTGEIRLAMVKHFGRMPLKPKIHETMDVTVDGVSFELSMDHLVVLIDIIITVLDHLKTDDALLLAEIEDARAVAEYAAEQIWKGSARRQAEESLARTRRQRFSGPNAMHDFYVGHTGAVSVSDEAANAALASGGGKAKEMQLNASDLFSGASDGKGSMADGARGRTILTGGTGKTLQTPFDAPRFHGDDDEEAVGNNSFELRNGDNDAAESRNRQDSSTVEPTYRNTNFPETLDDGDAVQLVVPLHSTETQDEVVKHRGRRRSFLRGSSKREDDSDSRASIQGTQDEERQDGDKKDPKDADPYAHRSRFQKFVEDSSDDDVDSLFDFANSVPLHVAMGFAAFMEDVNKADDDSKDYGIFFFHVNVSTLNGALRIPGHGYASIDLPNGVAMARSTVNDGNSNKRLSVAARDVCLKAFTERAQEFSLYRIPVEEASQMGEYVEVLHIQTSLCARQFIAHPFDGSLEKHRERQRQFVEVNDYEDLIRFDFGPSDADPSSASSSVPNLAHFSATSEVPTAQHSMRCSPSHPHSSLPSHPPTQPTSARGPNPNAALNASHAAASTVSPQKHVASPKTLHLEAANGSSSRGSEDTPHRAVTVPVDPPTLPRPHRLPQGSLTRRSSTSAETTGNIGGPLEMAVSSILLEPTPDRDAAESSTRTAPVGGENSATVVGQGMESSTATEGLTHGKSVPAANGSSGSSTDSKANSDDFSPGTPSKGVDVFTDVSKDMGTGSGGAFDACISASDFSDTNSELSTGDAAPHGRASQPRAHSLPFSEAGSPLALTGAASPTTNTADSSKTETNSPVFGTTSGKDASANPPPVPLYLFYRTYVKDEVDDGEGFTTLDFRVPGKPQRNRPIRNRTRFSAPLPSTAFRQSSAPNYFPEFYMATVLGEKSAESTESGSSDAMNLPDEGKDAPSMRVAFDWAKRTADNRQRSRAGETTKHFHLEAVQPVTVLVTKEAVELAAAAIATYSSVSTTYERSNSRSAAQRTDSSMALTRQKSNAKISRSRAAKIAFARQASAKKSSARERQIRWLSEDNITSVVVPCIELKVLTELPVAEENAFDHRHIPKGVYCTTLAVRDMQLYMWRNHPPSGVEASADATRRLSLSLELATISLVTQIEYEPIPRSGNLNVPIPGVYYDMEKDTIAVVYISGLRGSGKQDIVRGAEGGGCNIAVDTVSVTITRDLVEYFFAIKKTIVELKDGVLESLRPPESPQTSTNSSPLGGRPMTKRGRSASVRLASLTSNGGMTSLSPNSRGPRGAVETHGSNTNSDFITNPLLRIGFDRGRIVQGKGRIGALSLCVVDTRRDGSHIKVDLATATTLDVKQPNASFIFITPHRAREKNIQLLCIGEIDVLHAKTFPSLLHVVHAHAAANPQSTHPPPLSPAEELSRQSTMSLAPTRLAATERFGDTALSSTAHADVVEAARAAGRVKFAEPQPSSGSSRMSAPFSKPLSRTGTNDTNAFQEPASSDEPSAGQGLTRQSTAPGVSEDYTKQSSQEAPAKPKESVNLVYNCSFTLRTLNFNALYSEVNYVQLKGRDLMGCAESRGDKISSRECIQMEVLAEVITASMRRKLHAKAERARERAKRSRYASPPATTEQLQLKSSASFFVKQLQLQYVADPVIFKRNSNDAAHFSSPLERQQRLRDAQALVAVIDDVALTAQFTNQFDIAGEQANLVVRVERIFCRSPFRHNAEEVIHPQVHQFIAAWRMAAKRMHNRAAPPPPFAGGRRFGGPGSPLDDDTASPKTPVMDLSSARDRATSGSSSRFSRWNKAFFLTVQAKSIEAAIGLPQDITQRFLLPELSAFVQGSSDGRLSVKVHIHPFSITSTVSGDSPVSQDDYTVTLPNVYIMYAHDTIKMTSTLMAETIAITVTPLFINHMLLTYEKVTAAVIAVFSKAVPVDDVDKPNRRSTFSPLSPDDGSFYDDNTDDNDGSDVNNDSSFSVSSHNLLQGRSRRSSFLFLLQGVRISYLTSITNLRLTVRRANAVANSSESAAERTLHWIVNVINAQVALVDRSDHDQMVAVLDSTMRRRQETEDAAAGSPPPSTVGARPFDSKRQVPSAMRSRSSTRRVLHATLAVPPNGTEDSRSGVSSMSRAASTGFPSTAATGQTSGKATAATSVSEEPHRMRAEHPLSGFIWGSAELSFTLSSGTLNHNKAKMALTETASFNAYSSDLQKALLDTLGHSYSQWELSIFSPLVILRFGLPVLLRMCFDETSEDIHKMKKATEEENNLFRARLNKHRAFRKLQQEKKRYETLLARTQTERMRRLRKMTVQVAHDMTRRRRGGVAVDEGEAKILLECFNITSEHRFAAKLTGFLAVVPFGDAAFRSLLEDLPETYVCGRKQRHIHTAACLSRKRFIPTLALKARIEQTSFICNFTSVKRFVPVAPGSDNPTSNDGSPGIDYGTGFPSSRQPSSASLEQDAEYVRTLTFCGRFVVYNTDLYFTEGSAVEDATGVADLVSNTGILGGIGILTDYAADEIQRSRNAVHIVLIESPLSIRSMEGYTQVGALFDLSGPRIQLSSRIANILSEFASEAPSKTLAHEFRWFRQHSDNSPKTRDKHDKSGTPQSARATEGDIWDRLSKATKADRDAWGSDANAASNGYEQRGSSHPGRLHVDISARLAEGEIRVFAHTKVPLGAAAAVGSPVPVSASDNIFDRHAGSASRRRAIRTSVPSSSTGKPKEGSSDTSFNVFAQQEDYMQSLLMIPLPGVVLQLVSDQGGPEREEDITVARVELRAGTIELTPSITSLAREIEECAKVYSKTQLERRKAILARVQSLEKDVAVLNMPMHGSLIDLLLPLPWALCNRLSKQRMQTAIQMRRDGSQRLLDGDEDTSSQRWLPESPLSRMESTAEGRYEKDKDTDADNTEDPTKGSLIAMYDSSRRRKKRKAFTGIHITVKTFRVTLTTEPVASTTFTVYLAEKSSVDLLIKLFRHQPDETPHFLNKFPDMSIMMSVRWLRAECQTKLEVKSLEVALPEAELNVSKRRGLLGNFSSFTVSLPLRTEGTDPNFVLRVQHMSQVFTVVNLWTATLKDTLLSVRHLTEHGAPADVVAQQVTRSGLAQRVRGDGSPMGGSLQSRSRRFILTFSISRGMFRVELGSGNSHQVFFHQGRLALESSHHETGTHVMLIMAGLNNFTVSSEGVLSGLAGLGSAELQAFIIRNKEGAPLFVRSPNGRTFRETLVIQDVNVTFKERTLRDIFECKVGQFEASAMDGMTKDGADTYSTTQLDISLTDGTLGVTPNTVPAVLNFVRTASAIVAEQQRIAHEKTKGVVKLRHLLQSQKAKKESRSDALSSKSASNAFATARSTSATQSNWDDLYGKGGDTAHDDTASESASSSSSATSTAQAAKLLPFFANHLDHVPCGELRFTIVNVTLLLGSTSSSAQTAGGSRCVVASFPRSRLSFAESPSDDYTIAKKVLKLQTRDVELCRPGTPRMVIIGFRGTNILEFYTWQVLGESKVGFTLTLQQTFPWTGTPSVEAFTEVIGLVKSFTNKKNAAVFQRFGRFDSESAKVMAAMRGNSTLPGGNSEFFLSTPQQSTVVQRNRMTFKSGTNLGNGAPGGEPADPLTPNSRPATMETFELETPEITQLPLTDLKSDPRELEQLRPIVFSPQLRFGGELTMDTKVILEWLGIAETRLPNVLNAKLCDKLESVLNYIARSASERMRADKKNGEKR